MKKEELLAVLRLQKTKLLGDILAKKLIAKVGSASAIFDEKKHHLNKIEGIGKRILNELCNEATIPLAEKELDYLETNKISYSYFLEDDYPTRLLHCVDGPILFFKDGNLDLTNQKIISIVGTRNMTNYGRDFCNSLVEKLQEYNPIIVSGFAYGVDICAHKAALKNNLQTVAVLAHGFNQIYPKTHKKYIHQVNENGGFITEFFHDEQPLRENFLKRNRIVAGLSEATIIVESAEKGGSLVTADIANSYDREVFAVPGKTSDLFSKGCNNLIQNNKAHLLQSAEDIVQLLNWDVQKKKVKKHQPKLFIDLTEKEQQIYDVLLKGEQLLDVIAKETNTPVYELATILLQMELKGVVKPLPGKSFSLV